MKIKGRYKLLGKRKFAQLEMPYEKVKEAFNNAVLERKDEFPLQITFDQKSEIYKIFYEIENGKGDVFETFCLLVEFKKKSDKLTEIEYNFVFDRLMSYYTKFLSIICVVAPLISVLIAYFVYNFTNVWFYIPVGLVAAFGIFSLFGFKERADDVRPIVTKFENMLMKIFN